MNNEDVIKRINEHQNNPRFHPLTCGNDSGHRNLVPIEVDGKVILKCLDCDYTQGNNFSYMLF